MKTLTGTQKVTIFEMIALERKRQGLTVSELAKRAGLHRNYVSDMERGKAGNPSLSALVKIFDALGYDLNIKFDTKEREAKDGSD